MQTMFLANKCQQYLMAVLLFSAVEGEVCASETPVWVDSQNSSAHLVMADGSRYDLVLPADTVGIFYHSIKHDIQDGSYVSVLNVLPSSPGKPTEFCGAGNEIWLTAYKAVGVALEKKITVLVSSCIHSISLVSQNTGDEMQDTDFSSIQWASHGFLIDWFNNINAAGQRLSSTIYTVSGSVFSAREVLVKDVRGK